MNRYVLHFRTDSRARWREVGRFVTYADMVAAVNGKGDWWLQERADHA